MANSSDNVSKKAGGIQNIDMAQHADDSTSFEEFWADLTKKDPRWKTYNEELWRIALEPVSLPDPRNSIEIAWPEDVVDLVEPYQFTLFPTLPLELRRQIWKFALPEPRLILTTFYRPSDTYQNQTSIFKIESCNSLAASDVAPFLSCHEAWTLFCENYQRMQAFGVTAHDHGIEGIPRRIDFHRDQLSLFLPGEDIYQAANEVDLSKVEHLILSPFHQTPLRPGPSLGEQSHERFDFLVTSALKCCPCLKTFSLDYSHGFNRPPFPNTSSIWVERIDADFESKVTYYPGGSNCDMPFIVQMAKRRHQSFDDVIKKQSKSRQHLEFSVCAFGTGREQYWRRTRLPGEPELDIVKLVPVTELPYKTTFFAIRTPLSTEVYFTVFDILTHARNGVLLPRSDYVEESARRVAEG